jgi:beta-glucosidase
LKESIRVALSILEAPWINLRKNSVYRRESSSRVLKTCNLLILGLPKTPGFARRDYERSLPLALKLPRKSSACAQEAHPRPQYLDTGLPIERRIDDLLPRLTIQEKVSSTGATIFPQPIAMAATFDPDLIRQVGQETAVESKAAHIRPAWSPVINLARDVRWGRTEETFGESPYLASRMGVAWIEGFQGEGMIATPKHYAVHGNPLGGRDSNDIGLSNRVMREIFLLAFRAAIEEAHAGSIMAAYSSWQGVPDNVSDTLLTKILREEWGFDGFVVSDCGALENLVIKQGIAVTREQAAAMGIAAGVNMNCGTVYKDWARKAVADGLVTEAQLDAVVRPVLRAKFRLGLFEHPEPSKMIWDKLPEYDTAPARALARRVELEGAVLLKNDNHMLPLDRSMGTIAVIGPNADTAQTGDYSAKPAPHQLVTVLDGIRSHVSPQARVLYAAGLLSPVATDATGFAQAVQVAKQADVAVIVVGDNSHPGSREDTSGENNDGATLDFPGAQRALIQAVQKTGTPVVLVLVNGKPFTLGWEAEHVPAILATWYPGEAGGDATADLLFGDQNPSGRLPVSWPRSPGQLLLNYDYLPSGRRYDYYDMPFAPQWRFGFGMTYTQFRYTNLRITPKADDPGFVTVNADVKNVGSRDGDEVCQLYVTDTIASVLTPVIELEGVQRIALKAGEQKTVTFHLTPYQLSLLDANMVRRVEPGEFRIHVGGVSPDVPAGVVDDRKRKIGFNDPLEGVSGSFDEPTAYSARFAYSLDAPSAVHSGQSLPVTVTVLNQGNLTDVTEAKLFDGLQIGSWSFEVPPGETKTHTFQVTLTRSGQLTLVAGTELVTRAIHLRPQ